MIAVDQRCCHRRKSCNRIPFGAGRRSGQPAFQPGSEADQPFSLGQGAFVGAGAFGPGIEPRRRLRDGEPCCRTGERIDGCRLCVHELVVVRVPPADVKQRLIAVSLPQAICAVGHCGQASLDGGPHRGDVLTPGRRLADQPGVHAHEQTGRDGCARARARQDAQALGPEACLRNGRQTTAGIRRRRAEETQAKRRALRNAVVENLFPVKAGDLEQPADL